MTTAEETRTGELRISYWVAQCRDINVRDNVVEIRIGEHPHYIKDPDNYPGFAISRLPRLPPGTLTGDRLESTSILEANSMRQIATEVRNLTRGKDSSLFLYEDSSAISEEKAKSLIEKAQQRNFCYGVTQCFIDYNI